MKTRIIFIIFFVPFFLSAQSDRIEKLESEVSGTSGKVYVQNMLTLIDAYLDEGFPDLATKAVVATINQSKKIGDNALLAKAYNREAKCFKLQGDYSKAQKRIRKSQKLLSKIDDRPLQFDNAYTLLQLAMLRQKSKEIKTAENQIAILKNKLKLSSLDIQELKRIRIYNIIFPEAVEMEKISEENENLSGKVENINEKSEVLEKKKTELNSIVAAKEQEIIKMSESQAKAILLVEQQKRVLDSLNFQSEIDSLVLAISEKELSNAENALKEQEMATAYKQSQRNLSLVIAGSGFLIAIGMFLRFLGLKNHSKVLEEKNKMIEAEKERSEELLLNILPKAIARELKEDGHAKAKHYSNVTVLFADFKNFSQIAKKMSPEDLIDELDFCFKEFDRITSRLNLEKIKTIGDCYMCAGGLPLPNSDHPKRVIQAALEMQAFLEGLKIEKIKRGEEYFEARIGIHSGPIIAGVVGLKKFAYDI